MARTLLVCALLGAPLLLSRAQDTAAPTETVIKLTIRPTPAPRPALKYQLLPELREMKSGNSAQAYLKCFMEQNNFFYNKEAVAEREKYQTMPLKDLPVKKLKGYGGLALRQADYAARLDAVDWQILPLIRRDGHNLLLPELAPLRNLATALKVRFRVEVAEGRFDDAIRTAKTMLALARHLEEFPSLIGNLVGAAIVFVAIGPLEELIQQPGSPNLYWALTDLPRPLVGVRKGIQGERVFLASELAVVEEAPMSEAQVNAVLHKFAVLYKNARIGLEGGVIAWVRKKTEDRAHVAAARKRLVEAGLPEAQVKRYSAGQVVLLDEKRTAELRRDDEMKWASLPYWQIEANVPPPKKSDELFVPLLPAMLRMAQAQARLEQRIALLRHVEALRLHAAAHGKLPARLADVGVPLPVDPVSGKPFVYKVEGQTATIRGTAPKGREKVAAFNVRYEVTLTK